MTMKILLEALSRDQSLALAQHCAEVADVQRAANNSLIIKLNEIVGTSMPQTTMIEEIQRTLMEWSLFLNSITDDSSAEVSRIANISTTETIQ